MSSRGNAVPLFDDLVGAGEQRGRHVDTMHFCRLEIDHEVEFGRLLNWNIGGIGAAQDLVH